MAQTKKQRRSINGVLLLDKPCGLTSNAAIQRVKRAFNAEKAGHVGTLDPMASGLLPVCLGEATKFSTDAFSADKSYQAEVLLGITTTTGDREGEVLTRTPVSVTREQVSAVMREFTGRIEQTPPMYSALKRDGKPLYAYARAGVTLERAARSITIYEIALADFAGDRVQIDVSCSKGTYIRVLAEDIGKALGCGATLAALRRTRVGSFDLAHSVGLSDLERMLDEDRLRALQPVDCLASGLPAVALDSGVAARLLQGQGSSLGAGSAGGVTGLVRLYGPESRFIGLGELAPDGRLVPKRLVATSGTP